MKLKSQSSSKGRWGTLKEIKVEFLFDFLFPFDFFAAWGCIEVG